MFDTREAPQKGLIANDAHHGDANVLAKGVCPGDPRAAQRAELKENLPDLVLLVPRVPIKRLQEQSPHL